MKHNDNFPLFTVLGLEGRELCKTLSLSYSSRPSAVIDKDTNLRWLSTWVIGGKREEKDPEFPHPS